VCPHWSHGKAVTVENPDNFISIKHVGWGTDLEFFPRTGKLAAHPGADARHRQGRPGKRFRGSSCCSTRTARSCGGVHIYHGQNRIEQIKEGSSWANTAAGLDTQNTFTLRSLIRCVKNGHPLPGERIHLVRCGGPSTVTVVAAGAVTV